MATDKRSVLAKRLEGLRGSRTQQEVAAACGISRVAYGYYEADKRKPDFETLVNMANYFDVSMDYLAGRSDVKSIEPDIQAACELTGLSEASVAELSNYQKQSGETRLNTAFDNSIHHSYPTFKMLETDDFTAHFNAPLKVLDTLISNPIILYKIHDYWQFERISEIQIRENENGKLSTKNMRLSETDVLRINGLDISNQTLKSALLSEVINNLDRLQTDCFLPDSLYND